MKPTTPSRSTLTGANPHTRANLSTRATRHTRANLSTRPGLTIREVLAATAVTGAALCLALPLLAQVRSDDRQQRDAVQLRGLLDAFTIWAGNNKEAFPLPSQLDVSMATIRRGFPGEADRSKDDTGNIVSVLIWNSLVRPESVVSPAETNSSVSVDLGYQFAQPALANRPAEALWDPGFAGTPFDWNTSRRNAARVANQSYAHGIPFGRRETTTAWGTTSATTRVIWANRGPVYSTTTRPANGWQLAANAVGTGSNTLRFFGPADSWEGHVASIDGSVDFVIQPDPAKNTYRPIVSGVPGPAQSDNLFVDETDETTFAPDRAFGVNNNIFLQQISGVTASGSTSTVALWRD